MKCRVSFRQDSILGSFYNTRGGVRTMTWVGYKVLPLLNNNLDNVYDCV